MAPSSMRAWLKSPGAERSSSPSASAQHGFSSCAGSRNDGGGGTDGEEEEDGDDDEEEDEDDDDDDDDDDDEEDEDEEGGGGWSMACRRAKTLTTLPSTTGAGCP